MSGSSAERQIRDAAAAFLRAQLPAARIVHELVVDDCRADLAAIERERLTLVEIKSSKDTLSRVDRQSSRFSAGSHETIVVADARWFDEFDYDNGSRGFRPCADLDRVRGRASIWRYPEPKLGDFAVHWPWRLARPSFAQPHAAKLLGLLWKAELLQEAHRHRVTATSRSTISDLIEGMAYLMTGREIAQAVCRQLRLRAFPEADAPIGESIPPPNNCERKSDGRLGQ